MKILDITKIKEERGPSIFTSNGRPIPVGFSDNTTHIITLKQWFRKPVRVFRVFLNDRYTYFPYASKTALFNYEPSHGLSLVADFTSWLRQNFFILTGKRLYGARIERLFLNAEHLYSTKNYTSLKHQEAFEYLNNSVKNYFKQQESDENT